MHNSHRSDIATRWQCTLQYYCAIWHRERDAATWVPWHQAAVNFRFFVDFACLLIFSLSTYLSLRRHTSERRLIWSSCRAQPHSVPSPGFELNRANGQVSLFKSDRSMRFLFVSTVIQSFLYTRYTVRTVWKPACEPNVPVSFHVKIKRS